jgi:hypothetical protein
MPKSMHESAEIHSKTIEHLKELKQINKNCFLGVVGRRVGQNGAKWTNMGQHGAKRIPKGSQKRPKWSQKAIKKQNKMSGRRCSEKFGSRSVSGRKVPKKNGHFSRKGGQKGAFLEIPKIENGTKIQLFSKDRHRDPLKTVPGSGFEKT